MINFSLACNDDISGSQLSFEICLFKNNINTGSENGSEERYRTSTKASPTACAGHVGHITTQVTEKTNCELSQTRIQMLNLPWRCTFLGTVNKRRTIGTVERIVHIAKRDELGLT